MPTLSEFAANIRSANVSRPYLYYVQLLKPLVLSAASTTDAYNIDKINMFCHGASTPHLGLYTNDEYNENGQRRKFVYEYDYQNLVLQFYIDQKYEVKNFFDNWMKEIVPSKRNFQYYDSYVSRMIRVYIVDMEDKETYQYSYINCVPKTVNSIDLNYSTTGQVSSFTVEFVFESVVYSKMDGAVLPQDEIVTGASPTVNLEVLQTLGLNFSEDPWDTPWLSA